MKEKSTIKEMLQNKEIIVPAYQRAYSWETPQEGSDKKTHVDVFINDIEEYMRKDRSIPYYFGHFLFEKIGDEKFGVVDGQQRLTTIMLFLSALYRELENRRKLTEDEERNRRIIKDGTRYGFSTVDYDNVLMRDYAINRIKKHITVFATISQKRIVQAYDYFANYLSRCDEPKLTLLLNTVMKSACTTHVVNNEAEAVQMFIFQNDRGKRPSQLEVVKAHLIYHILLNNTPDDAKNMLDGIQRRFERIYFCLNRLEFYVEENNLLQCALRIHRNTLDWVDVDVTMSKEFAKDNQETNQFIEIFVTLLQQCAEYLEQFFINDQELSAVHSLIVLGANSDLIPFIIKSYRCGISEDSLCRLCRTLERITLRDKLIGTRAVLVSRLKDVYRDFNGDIEPLECRINELCSADAANWWWAYWNNDQFKASIMGGIYRKIAKYILWKYENYLIGQGCSGYRPMRYSDIVNPELEHIAPQTRPTTPDCGYCEYDDEFLREYLDCLGNYLLLSKSHNCSASNSPLGVKLKEYTHLRQQREVVEMVGESNLWDKEKIICRKNKIIDFIMSEF